MKHHIQLDLRIAFSSQWHMGSGEAGPLSNRLMRRDSLNRPFIPGSTIKGVIRQSCEKLSRTKGYADLSNPHSVNLREGHSFVDFERIKSPVDRLFGTKFHSGGLFFRDARLGPDADFSSQERSRIARYRFLKTARDKHLFATEYASKNALHTQVDGWHEDLVCFDPEDPSYPPYAYCLLIAGILGVDRIGGDKSTGSGWLRQSIVVESGNYNRSPIDINKVFELLNIIDPEDYSEMRDEK